MTFDVGWYAGRKIFITGHTGFKGAWLSSWLCSAGASVTGYALSPANTPNLFDAAGLGDPMTSIIGDVGDRAAFGDALARSQPEIVFHLAAQSLVRPSYADPVGTFATNVMGTVHLLDLLRDIQSVRSVVVVTSDKCYENREVELPYTEDAAMGGHDPYSASKGCTELVTSAMRRSFFDSSHVGVASARAGNVFGGGDWAVDRLVPDMMRAAAAGEVTRLRNPTAVRPWQHVLEPLRGYLMLGRALAESPESVIGGWNFGPREADCVAVAEVADRMHETWDRVVVRHDPDDDAPHEASLLKLDCSKAREQLGWEPEIGLDLAVEMTVDWYRRFYDEPSSAASLVAEQLGQYSDRFTKKDDS